MAVTRAYEKMMQNIKEAIVSDNLRRRVLFYFLNITLSLTSLVMSIINYFTAEYVLLAATLIFSVVCLGNVFLLHGAHMRESVIFSMFGAESLLLLLFFFISGIPNGFSALWICLIPSFAMLIFRVKRGSAFCCLAFVMMIFLFWTPVGRSLLLYAYTDEFMLRFPFLYLSVFLISLLIELVRRETQTQLETAKQEYRYLYRHDALTGLYNRYGIKEYMDKAFSGQSHHHVSVILFDIDNFKAVNDVYGHECGDEVLKTVASVPLAIMCDHCHCCRWGGEEFLLIMQCEHNATEVAEQIRQKVEQTPIRCAEEEIHVTISAGVCTASDLSHITIHDVIEHADRALYASKTSGKNQVTTCSLFLSA